MVEPPANGAHSHQQHYLLEKLVIPIVVALVVAIIGSTPPLLARGSIGLALGLWGIAAVVMLAVGILATTTGILKKIWDRVKRFPVKTVLAVFVAAALGFWIGLLVSRSGVNRAGYIVQWVNGGSQPNTSWLVEKNGERYWIPNANIFYCLVNEGYTDRGPQSSTVLDHLPDSGQWASCPATVSRAAYIGHIVEWVNGGRQPNTSWLVGNNGERYWIPNTSIFFCLVKKGYIDRGPQSSTVLDDLPDLGQWASCA